MEHLHDNIDLPLVFVDRRIQGVDSVPFVVSDPYPGILAAIRDLTRLGHRRIGFVAHPSLGSFSVNERRTAFEAIAAGSAGTVDPVVVSCDSTYESRKEALANLRDAGASAVICAYSPDAITMIGLLHDADAQIGRDLSVVSFDDIDAFRLMTPSISVISQQAETMGLQGVAMLLDQIASKESSKGGTYHIPTVYIPRRSTGRML